AVRVQLRVRCAGTSASVLLSRRPLQLRALRHSERFALARRPPGLPYGDGRAAVHRLSGLRAPHADGVRRFDGGGERRSSSGAERAEADRSARPLPAVARVKNRIALATYEHAPGLASDDEPLVAALTSHGFEARPVVWSDADAAWESFDA